MDKAVSPSPFCCLGCPLVGKSTEEQSWAGPASCPHTGAGRRAAGGTWRSREIEGCGLKQKGNCQALVSRVPLEFVQRPVLMFSII